MDGRAFAIALDGPAASGKSTVGMGVARELGFAYFDTGLLYRALTRLALERGLPPTDAAALAELAGRLDVEVGDDGQVLRHGREITADLHGPEVDGLVSIVAAHGAVREALVPVQRGMLRPPGMVMAGRDIGTVILPDASLKIWLSAGIDERARRRAAQTGEALSSVLERMARRDEVDSSRSVAPMEQAPDAVVVITDGKSPAEVISEITHLARERGAARARA